MKFIYPKIIFGHGREIRVRPLWVKREGGFKIDIGNNNTSVANSPTNALWYKMQKKKVFISRFDPEQILART